MNSTSEPREDRNSLGKAAGIVGVIALILSFIPFIGFVSWILAPLAVLFGLIALRRPSKSWAIVGIITGAIALVICFSWLSATKSMGEAMSADTFNTTGEVQNMDDAPIMEATISGVWDDLEKNKVAAGQKYGGSRLQFKDEKISDFSGDADNPAMQFVGKTEDYLIHFVSASFAKKDGEAIGKLGKGKAVSFTCNKINEGFGDGFNLAECSLD